MRNDFRNPQTFISSHLGHIRNGFVIEVGPGPGNLTRPILEAGANCAVIEKDYRFRPCLDLLAEAAQGRLKVINPVDSHSG